MAKLEGIKVLSEVIYDGIPISLSNPKNIKNGYLNFDDPSMSTIVGLLEYCLSTNRNYELDSSKQLIKPVKKELRIENKTVQNPSISMPDHGGAPLQSEPQQPTMKHQDELKDNPAILTPLQKDKKKGVSKFWSKISEWF